MNLFNNNSSRWFLTICFFLLTLLATPARAWDQELIDAANAVASGENLTKKQYAMVLSRNYDINLLAIRGKIDKKVFQICQHKFVKVSNRIGKKAAEAAGVKFTVQKPKKISEYEPSYKAGTDSDYITGATKPEEVKLMQKKYNDDFTKHLQKLDENIPENIKWTIKNDIDFMADAKAIKSTKDFEEIAKLNNAAYTRPGSARYEAYSRGKGGRPSLQDSIDYMDEMQDAIKHRDDVIKGPMTKLDEIIDEMQAIGKGADGYAALKRQGEALSTEIFKQRALQAKYMDRINLATENLKKWLPEGSPLLVGSKLPADNIGLTKSAALRDMLLKESEFSKASPVIDAIVIGKNKTKIVQQQLQQHLEVMAAVMEHHPEKTFQLHDAVKKYASLLKPQQQNEVLDAIRKSFGEKAAGKMAAMFKGITNDPEILLRKFFKTILSESDFKKAIKALDEGNLETLPVKAKIWRERIFNISANKNIKLSNISTEDFLVKFGNDFKIKGIKGESKDTLIELLKKLDQSSDPSVYKRMFGERLGKKFAKLKELMPDKVKISLIKKLSKRIPLKTLDGKWTSLEFGDSGSALGADAVIGIAMTYYDIDNIMKKNLSPAEEKRQLENAIVSNMPIVGDFLMGLNAGFEAGFEGSYSKGAQSAAYLVIGIAGLVPGAQVPALVAGLGMAGYGLGSAAWDLSSQRDIIWAWVASGNWDSFEPNGVFRSGKMVGLYDAKGKLHKFGAKSNPMAESKYLLDQFITKGDVFYHTPMRLSTHTSGLPDKTIRDSIYDFSELTVLRSVKEFEVTKTALLQMYPDFDVDKYLRIPVNLGRTALFGHIREKANVVWSKSRNLRNNVAITLFSKLKAEYDKAAVEAVKVIRQDAEAEYQATFYAGEAKEVLQKLEELEQEYRFPFVKRVDAINDEILQFFIEAIKSPLEKHSIPRRRVDLAKEYVKAYDITIRESIRKIQEIFKKADVSTPSKINPYNLSGYIAPDLERITKLKRAYESAPKLVRDAMRKRSKLDPSSPCLNEVYKKLLSNRLRWTHANDIKLLYEEWAGRRGAAEEERDVAIQQAYDRIDAQNEGILTIPEYSWKQISKALGNLYAWEHLTVSWGESTYAFGAERKYLEATIPIRKRMDKLDKEKEEILSQLVNLDMSLCMSKLTIRLRTRISEKGPGQPIFGGDLTLHLPSGKAVSFTETSPGNYQIDTLRSETYLVVVSHRNFKGEDGNQIIKYKIVQGEPQPRNITKTIYMVPVPVQVTIEVVDDLGNVVPSADVSLYGSNWKSGKLRPVDSSGHIIFKDVPPGTYKVFAGAPGFETQTGGTQIKLNPLADKSGVAKRIILKPFLSMAQITVSDAFSEPIKDVQIKLGEKSGITDAQGQVIFNSVRPSGGLEPYKVQAKKEGYTSVSTVLEVSPLRENQKFPLSITLQGSVPLVVKVIDADSEPEKVLEGATVQLFYADEYKNATSDENGVVRFDAIAPSFIYISVALPGYQSVSREEKDLRFAVKEQTATIKLTQGMKITAYVKDQKGELLASGYISMDDGPFFEAPTGSREFTPVKEGRHMFRGRAKQFLEAAIFYEAKPKDKSSDNVSLKLLPGATIMVEVRNDRGELLRGKATKITLLKNGKSLKTATGHLKLFTNLEPATYSARAKAKEYVSSLSRSLDYSGKPPAFHDSLQVILTPKLQLSAIFVSVIARDEKGNPSNGPSKIKVTGPAGSFTEQDLIGMFPDLIPGKYSVITSVKGFISQTKTVTVSPDQPGKIYTLSFNLTAIKKKNDDKPEVEPPPSNDETTKKDPGTNTSGSSIYIGCNGKTLEEMRNCKTVDAFGPAQGESKLWNAYLALKQDCKNLQNEGKATRKDVAECYEKASEVAQRYKKDLLQKTNKWKILDDIKK